MPAFIHGVIFPIAHGLLCSSFDFVVQNHEKGLGELFLGLDRISVRPEIRPFFCKRYPAVSGLPDFKDRLNGGIERIFARYQVSGQILKSVYTFWRLTSIRPVPDILLPDIRPV
mgnify:CR=1 FL=1